MPKGECMIAVYHRLIEYALGPRFEYSTGKTSYSLIYRIEWSAGTLYSSTLFKFHLFPFLQHILFTMRLPLAGLPAASGQFNELSRSPEQ